MGNTITIGGTRYAATDGRHDWETGRPIGKGGQGRAYAARQPRADGAARLVKAMRRAGSVAQAGGTLEDDVRHALGECVAAAIAPYEHALKLCVPRDPANPQQSWDRFDREVAVLSDSAHPRIIRVVDSGRLLDGRRYIVMPLLKRGSLEAASERARFKGNALESLRAVADVVDALVHLNSNGLQHRDIKPANILVGDDGRLVLADFGLVYDPRRGESITLSGESVGNKSFGTDWADRDDEHARNPLADLYAAGRLLWWLASGMEPMRREEWRRPEFDLTRIFANAPEMARVNAVLARAVVDGPEDVQYADAAEMLLDVRANLQEARDDKLRAALRRGETFTLVANSQVDWALGRRKQVFADLAAVVAGGGDGHAVGKERRFVRAALDVGPLGARVVAWLRRKWEGAKGRSRAELDEAAAVLWFTTDNLVSYFEQQTPQTVDEWHALMADLRVLAQHDLLRFTLESTGRRDPKPCGDGNRVDVPNATIGLTVWGLEFANHIAAASGADAADAPVTA